MCRKISEKVDVSGLLQQTLFSEFKHNLFVFSWAMFVPYNNTYTASIARYQVAR